jgi:hypothetical protein
MATEKIEIQIIAKGKPAEKAIKGVEKKTKDLGEQSKKTGKDTDGMLTKMKAGWIAVGAAMAISVSKAATFERMSIGLTKAQKDWAKETALATDIQAEQVAGFLKSAQTAGLNEEAQRNLAKQAIALGYAFPHEQAETLHDNLVMLSSTGEAQGFVVDILEQQYAKMGIRFEDVDLKAVSMEEKLSLVNDVVKQSQEQMNSSVFKEYNETLGLIDNSATSLGETLTTLATESGALGLFNKLLGASDLLLKRLHLGVLGLSGIFNETNKERKRWLELGISVLEQDAKLYGSDNITKIGEYRRELNKINEELGIKKGILITLGDQETDYWDSIKEGVQEYSDTMGGAKKEQQALQDVGKKTAQSMEDAFVKMAMGAKVSFKDMARSIIADLIRIQVRKKLAGFLGNLDFFGGSSSAPIVDKSNLISSHTGGAIGMSAIPSFHQGFRSDDRMAKLQVGEAVVNRAGAARNAQAIDAMNAGMAVGGGGDTQIANITFQVQAFDSASFQQGMVKNRATIVGVVREAFNRNGKSVAL